MSFTTPIIYRPANEADSKEFIEWLEMLGYEESVYHNPKRRYDCTTIMVYVDNFYCALSHISGDIYYDCGSNLPLAKALSALRDDSDYMQWFYESSPAYYWNLSDKKWVADCNWCRHYGITHKASKDELIEHFKD